MTIYSLTKHLSCDQDFEDWSISRDIGERRSIIKYLSISIYIILMLVTPVIASDTYSNNRVMFGDQYKISIAKYWIDRGNELLTEGLYEKAIEHFDNALLINPMSIDAWIAKGQSLHNLGRYNESIECYDKALDIDSNSTRALIAKAISLLDSADFVNALECINKTLESNKYSADAWIIKGRILWALGKYNESIDCFDKALEINPILAAAYENKGLSYYELDDYYDAIECYDRAIDIEPKSPSTWLLKGLALYGIKEYTNSLECYNRSLEIDPSFVLAQIAYNLTKDEIKRSEILTIKQTSYPFEGWPTPDPAHPMPGICFCENTQRYEECPPDILPCIYGNYCGAGCSGNGGTLNPINNVDRCCQAHDNCYAERGYFACSCDRDIATCLRPNRNFGTTSGVAAWAMWIYFKCSPCNPTA